MSEDKDKAKAGMLRQVGVAVITSVLITVPGMAFNHLASQQVMDERLGQLDRNQADNRKRIERLEELLASVDKNSKIAANQAKLNGEAIKDLSSSSKDTTDELSRELNRLVGWFERDSLDRKHRR